MGRAWFAAGIAVAVLGTALTVVVLGRGGGLSVLHVVLTPVVGWSFGLAGLVAWRRPRWRAVGVLMVAVGLAWFVHLLDWTHLPVLEAAAAPLRNAYAAVFVHLLLAFPTGRLGATGTRALAVAGYVDAVGLHLAATTTGATIWFDVEAAVGVVLAVIVMAVLVRRTRKSAPRPAIVVWCAALVACAALVGNLTSGWLAPDLALALWVVFSAAFSAVPFGFLASDQLDGLAARFGAAERRRVERNLHDGAQQRLVSVAFALGVAQSRLSGDPAAASAALAEARTGLATALDELRRLSQGIHPGVLVERGLRAGVAELAWASPVPVDVEWHARDGRLPEAVELAAYYVVAEALANVAKHARATAVRVRMAERRGRVMIEIMDDGVGGAYIAGGSGLRGLTERVEGAGGSLTVRGGPAGGTTVRAELPCG
ncbi:histidine kinase [Micromonospora sp. WMMD1102]|uniref:sensor histidine kinase n=1 Tax=Micromonospora sp. WMMD1102 TaxID=3016105 RepID=UPI002414D7C5|nr:histidine kinase [Micromonospora sp. WMMD1102]MDG4785945.1 histidine kinase [Micromonospora sp. WMMD1102]